MAGFMNLTGKRFGRLLVQERAANRSGKTAWSCICDCGNNKDVMASSMISGRSKSCGCIHKEMLSDTKSTHGMSNTLEYRAWKHMRERCNSPADKRYINYGGRGITVCPKWDEFANFYTDMGPRPDGFSIERKNVNGNYEPDNCEWIDMRDQAKNRTDNRRITAFGITKILTDWTKTLGISRSHIFKRMRDGQSLEEIVSTTRGASFGL